MGLRCIHPKPLRVVNAADLIPAGPSNSTSTSSADFAPWHGFSFALDQRWLNNDRHMSSISAYAVAFA